MEKYMIVFFYSLKCGFYNNDKNLQEAFESVGFFGMEVNVT